MKLIHSFILISALALMTSCASTIRYNIILQIDDSMTISDSTWNKYLSIVLETILPNMRRNDRLVIQFVDECSITKAERIFSLDLATIKFSNKGDGRNNEKNLTNTRMKIYLKDSIKTILRTIILDKRKERNDCGNYTDIINALNEASSLITHDKSYKSKMDMFFNEIQGEDNYIYENCLIILSDMVNENREKTFDFTEFGKYNYEKVIDKLETLRKRNRIPDLSGCKILVYGATSTNQGIYANRQFENCKVFWQNFFHDSGADLIGYGYDSKKEIEDYMTSTN